MAASESDMLQETKRRTMGQNLVCYNCCRRFNNDEHRNKMYGVFIHLGRCVFVIGVMLLLVALVARTDTDDNDRNINFIITVLGVVSTIFGACFWILGTLLHVENLQIKDHPESKPFLERFEI